MSIRSLTLDFMGSTTTHGVGAISISKGYIKRIFWIMVTLIAAAALFGNMAFQIMKFFSYPITVEVSIEHVKGIEFPAVTLCNLNPVKKTLYNSNKLQARKKRSTDTQEDATCCCSCCAYDDKGDNNLKSCNLCNVNPHMKSTCSKPPSTTPTPTPTPTPSPTTTTTLPSANQETTKVVLTTTSPIPTTTKIVKVAKMEYKEAELLTENIVKMTPEERLKSGYSIDDLILNCSYAGSNCNSSYFSSINNPIHGNCFIFNPGWKHKPLLSYTTGRRYGLVLTLNVNQDEYVKAAGDIAGVRMLVHPGYEVPFPEDQGILAGPGHSYSISLNKMLISRVGGVYSNCVDEQDAKVLQDSIIYNEMYPKTNYSQAACQRSCYQGKVISECECADPYYPFYGKIFGYVNWTVCSIENKTQEDCKNRVLEQYNANKIFCDCPVVCNQVSYSTSISIGKWPSKNLLNKTIKYLDDKVSYDLNEDQKFKHNLLILEIFFEEFNFQVVSESPGYEVSQLLSDIGGVIGLYMGMSFMSVLELIEFLIMLCKLSSKKMVSKAKSMKRSQLEGNNNENINNHNDNEFEQKDHNKNEVAAVLEDLTELRPDRRFSESLRDVLLKF